MPDISVIVPVYNEEAYLSRCLNSILSQTFSEFEVILINDCSSDNSGQICDEYAKNDLRIKVVHKNCVGGASAARNIGLNLATGDFICFVDSDDYIHAHMFQNLYNIQHKYDADMVECNFQVVHQGLTSNDDDFQTEDLQIVEGRDLIPYIFQNRYGGSIYLWNKLYRRELFRNVRFVEGRMCEDTIIMPELYYVSHTVVITNRVYYYYFQSENSVMRSQFSLKKLDAIYAFQCNRSFFEEHMLTDAKLWLDTTYSFMLLKYFRKLNGLPDSADVKNHKLELKQEYYHCLREFLFNPHFNIKQRILLLENALRLLFVS